MIRMEGSMMQGTDQGKRNTGTLPYPVTIGLLAG